MLLNVCLTHGFIPNRSIASVITPVVKSNKNSVRDVNNYRPIALASTFSKLFELILLKYLESFLHTCDNQFGFHTCDILHTCDNQSGLQRLVDTCIEFAAKHNIVFNCRKTKAMYFPCKFFKTTDHNLTVNDQHVELVNSIKYLGVTISSVLSDELDIRDRGRSIYCIANMLRTRFFKCSVHVKNIFCYFCSSICGINLWCCYPASSINRLRVAYNNAYRILFSLPRRIHVNETMVNNGISTFYSLMRKHTANFIIRCKHSPNAYIQQIFGSACFLDSDFSVRYSKLHFG